MGCKLEHVDDMTHLLNPLKPPPPKQKEALALKTIWGLRFNPLCVNRGLIRSFVTSLHFYKRIEDTCAACLIGKLLFHCRLPDCYCKLKHTLKHQDEEKSLGPHLREITESQHDKWVVHCDPIKIPSSGGGTQTVRVNLPTDRWLLSCSRRCPSAGASRRRRGSWPTCSKASFTSRPALT